MSKIWFRKWNALTAIILFDYVAEKTDQIKMPAEVNVEELPNMEGDDYPDGMYVF